MKTFFSLLILFISSITIVNSQSFQDSIDAFVATADGLKSVKDNSKNYLVFEVEGKSAKEIYDNCLKYIVSTYRNPDYVIKGKIEGSTLSFDTHIPKAIRVKNSFVFITFGISYKTILKFKDGKFKMEIWDLKIVADSNGTTRFHFKYENIGSWYLYDRKGRLKQSQAKDDIEKFFNNRAKLIYNYAKGNEGLTDDNSSDDW